MTKHTDQYKKYLSQIRKAETLNDIESIENCMTNDKLINQSEFYDLRYHTSMGFEEMGWHERAVELADSYVMNLLKGNKVCKERTLYLFRKVDKYILADLKNHMVTAGNPENFNDPFDPLVVKFLSLKQENGLGQFHLIPSLNKVHITCFIEQGCSSLPPYQNRLMWANYADKHKGICIKYKIPANFPTTDNEFVKYGRIDNVVYTNRKISITKRNGTFQECFLQKTKEWEYEHEVRLIYFDKHNENEYVPISLENCQIESVYFGMCCNKYNMGRVKKALHSKDIKYYQMKSRTSDVYMLEAEQIKAKVQKQYR